MLPREKRSQSYSEPLISVEEFRDKKAAGALLLDVRSPDEVAEGAFEDAICIPHDELPERVEELKGKEGKEILIYCRVGGKADFALQVLKSSGFTLVFNAGGYEELV